MRKGLVGTCFRTRTLMWQTTGFLIFLVLTVLGLFFAVRAGVRRQRVPHLRWALSTVGLLAITVFFAFQMDKVRAFPVEEMKIHDVFSKSAAYLIPPAALTGWALWHKPGFRWAHRICVGLFLLATVGAAITGFWVLSLSSLK